MTTIYFVVFFIIVKKQHKTKKYISRVLLLTFSIFKATEVFSSYHSKNNIVKTFTPHFALQSIGTETGNCPCWLTFQVMMLLSI